MQKRATLIGAVLAAMLFSPVHAQEPLDRLTIDTGKPGVKVSPLLHGIFFEEINRAGDGGIYAEMLQNRSFEDNVDVPIAWKLKDATASLDTSNPINPTNPTSVR